MSFQMAVKQFQENIALRGGDQALAASDPEKFNLYAGLLNLASGLQKLEVQLHALQMGNARRSGYGN